jgi:hypothetical protein
MKANHGKISTEKCMAFCTRFEVVAGNKPSASEANQPSNLIASFLKLINPLQE